MAFASVAYRAQWQRRGDFAFVVQQDSTETQRWHSASE